LPAPELDGRETSYISLYIFVEFGAKSNIYFGREAGLPPPLLFGIRKQPLVREQLVVFAFADCFQRSASVESAV
jgi:hypothetical protein